MEFTESEPDGLEGLWQGRPREAAEEATAALTPALPQPARLANDLDDPEGVPIEESQADV